MPLPAPLQALASLSSTILLKTLSLSHRTTYHFSWRDASEDMEANEMIIKMHQHECKEKRAKQANENLTDPLSFEESSLTKIVLI